MGNIMELEITDLLISPQTGNSLELSGDGRALVAANSGERFPIVDGMPDFMAGEALSQLDKEAINWFDLMGVAFSYDWRLKWMFWRKGISEKEMRLDCLNRLEIMEGGRVLETSVGTGTNLQYFPTSTQFFGLDISWKMLRYCQRKIKRWGREATLFRANASERLPFIDHAFDVVFHMAGIQYFDDPAGAVREMIRVAKPGTRIVVADQPSTTAQTLSRVAGSRGSYNNLDEAIADLPAMLPPGMTEIEAALISQGELYCLSFRTPV
ncbi:MAG: methyltransferase domain-containing protein [Candidatus Promineifilaceae bacterium]